MAIKKRKAADDGRSVAASRAKASSNIGPRLRQAREHRNLSLRGLARYVGVSPSLVSQIERGHTMPSVGTLYAMANELGLVVDDLFTDASVRGRRNERREMSAADAISPVLKSGQRQIIRLADGVRWERLTPTPDREVEFLIVVYEVGAESCPKDALIRHGGQEYAYLLSGRMESRSGSRSSSWPRVIPSPLTHRCRTGSGRLAKSPPKRCGSYSTVTATVASAREDAASEHLLPSVPQAGDDALRVVRWPSGRPRTRRMSSCGPA